MTTPDILAAAERYRQHLEATDASMPYGSPYWHTHPPEFYLDDALRKQDMEILARAYVEERKGKEP